MSRGDAAANWARLRRAFDEVVALDNTRRAAMLVEIGASDPALRDELERMLAADSASDNQLARLDRLFDQSAGKPDPLGLIGRTIGHFQVIAPLAAGGMGVVYSARDTNLGRAVALKFPLPHQHLDWQIAERFRREARAVAALDHPNVCSVYEAGETDDGQLFLAMAFYDGETLKDRLAREGSLPIQDAVDIGAQVARGLGAAHRAGIVHRDLKPANVMLLPDGGVKILDFGVARMTDAALTITRGTPGTIAYMAPESVRGDGSDARSDLWALGVVLYEMLAGERPFQQQHDIALMHAILSNEPVRPSLLRTGIDPGLEQLILSLLAKDPRDRPESADRVLAALGSLDQERRPASASSVTKAAVTSSQRRPRLTMVVVAAMALPLLGLGVWYAQQMNGGDGGTRTVAVLPFQATGDSVAGAIGAALADAVANRFSRLKSVAVPDDRVVHLYSSSDSDATRDIPVVDVVGGRIDGKDGDLVIAIEMYDAKRRRRSTVAFTVAQQELHTAVPRISREIASGLRLDLTREERTMLGALPTANAAAWKEYLTGRAIQLQNATAPPMTEADRLRQMQSAFANARDLDPAFALARARLALVHWRISLTYDTTFTRREQARTEAEAALRLDSGLPEAHTALLFYYGQKRDQARADSQLQLAIAAAPNRSNLRLNNAVRLRDAGQWKEAVDEFQNAIRLDPRNTLVLSEAAMTFSRLRRYEDAIAAWDRVIALDPGDLFGKVIRGHQYLRLGIVDTLAATVNRLPMEQDETEFGILARYHAWRVQRRYDDILALLDSTRRTVVGDLFIYRPIILLRAMTLDDMGEKARARPAYEAARDLLEDTVRARPRDSRIHIALGLVYAGLGRRSDAAGEARTAMELSPLTSSALANTAFIGEAVEVFIRAGEYDEAILRIEQLLTMHAGRELSVPLLRVDPRFDPLRGDPRFERLLVQFARP